MNANTKIDIFNVDAKYINYLRERDKNVIAPDITNLYYGPVMTLQRNGKEINFYVPVVNNTEIEPVSTAAFANGIFCELDFRHMIPCSEKWLSEGKYDSERTNFFISNHEMLKSFALETYRNVCLSFSRNE